MVEDTFLEQLTKRKMGFLKITYFIFVITLAVVVAAALNVIPLLFGYNIIFVTGIMTIGLGFLVYLLLRRKKVEYEMIITNDEVSITRIIAKKNREELAEFSLRDCEYIGSVTCERFAGDRQAATFRLNITSDRKYKVEDSNWYFYASMGGYTCVIVFEFDPKYYKTFRRFNPRKTMPYTVPVEIENNDEERVEA